MYKQLGINLKLIRSLRQHLLYYMTTMNK